MATMLLFHSDDAKEVLAALAFLEHPDKLGTHIARWSEDLHPNQFGPYVKAWEPRWLVIRMTNEARAKIGATAMDAGRHDLVIYRHGDRDRVTLLARSASERAIVGKVVNDSSMPSPELLAATFAVTKLIQDKMKLLVAVSPHGLRGSHIQVYPGYVGERNGRREAIKIFISDGPIKIVLTGKTPAFDGDGVLSGDETERGLVAEVQLRLPDLDVPLLRMETTTEQPFLDELQLSTLAGFVVFGDRIAGGIQHYANL
jgi:hypothetical protein